MSRALRVGIILGDQIIEDHIFSQQKKVTVGASPRNDIALPSCSLPRSAVLFVRHGSGWSLRRAAGMEGRIAVGRQVCFLHELTGEGGEVPLHELARGKVTLGDVSLLFQFVEAPAVTPRPQLPPSVRGGVASRIDWALAACFVAVTMVHGSALAYMKTLDHTVPEVVALTGPWIEGTIPKMPPPVVQQIEKSAGVGEAPVKPADKPRADRGKRRVKRPKPAAPCDAACKEAAAVRRRAALARQVARHGVPKILGSRGAGAGMLPDLVKGGDPGEKVARAFSGMSGVTLSSNGLLTGLDGKGASGDGRIVKAGDLMVKGPREVKSGEMVRERVPTARVKAVKPEIEDGKLEADATYRIIRSGMRCVQNQYQRGLKGDPKLQGKLAICLTVNLMGKVRSLEVEEDSIGSPSLTAGVSRCLKRLRFPRPDGGSAEVCVPLLLKPAGQ